MSLPSGYKRIEYIQSSGTQYIDTGFKPNQNSRVVADFQLTASGKWQSVFGAWKYTSAYVDSFVFLATSSNFFRTDFGADSVSFSSSISTLNRHIVDHNKTSVTLDSTTVSHSSQTFSSSYNLNIFAGNTGGTASEFAKMKLYSCQIYDNGTLIRDYIPCKKPDGTIGLWDDVNSLFYGNAGTGTFTAGPVLAIAANVSEITELEYIQSSGEQYIDTVFCPNQNTSVIAVAELTEVASYPSIFGTRNKNTQMYWMYNNGNGTISTSFVAKINSTEYSLSSAFGEKQTYSIDSGIAKVGESIVNVSMGTFQSIYNLYLFGTDNAGILQYPAKMKLYSCKIYDNGTLVRDYVAAKLSDGTIGLYDKLHGLLYTNMGTGTFIAGPVVTSPSIFVNIDGIWKPINHIYVNINNIWQKST